MSTNQSTKNHASCCVEILFFVGLSIATFDKASAGVILNHADTYLFIATGERTILEQKAKFSATVSAMAQPEAVIFDYDAMGNYLGSRQINATVFAQAQVEYGRFHFTGSSILENSPYGYAGVATGTSEDLHLNLNWYDTFKLQYTLPGAPPAFPTSLDFIYDYDWIGSHEHVGGGSYVEQRIGTTTEFWNFGFYSSLADSFFVPTASFSVRVDNSGFGDNSASISIGLRTAGGESKLLAPNTIKPSAILMPDGTTPESHGWEIVFDSGLQSPNLVSVPEPTSFSLSLWALFAAIGTIVRCKQRLRRLSA